MSFRTKLLNNVQKYYPLVNQVRHELCCPFGVPRHLICFKQWNAPMVNEVLVSAMNLKCRHRDTHNMRLVSTHVPIVNCFGSFWDKDLHHLSYQNPGSTETLANSKIMILQEVNEPILGMAVSKAASLLGATDTCITDHLVWDHDYNGCIFACMSDAIFVSTRTHTCVQRFAEKSPVPVLCMKSRTHASIQALATVMAIIEEFGTMRCVNVAWLGAPHPILNSYLLLCPMLGANIRFKCCCKKCPVSPLLLKSSEAITSVIGTEVKECPEKTECLDNGCVFISGPACENKDKISEFKLNYEDVYKATSQCWIYFHTCPRGEEVDDLMFYHCNARTFVAFENMHYIAAALMAYCIKGFTF